MMAWFCKCSLLLVLALLGKSTYGQRGQLTWADIRFIADIDATPQYYLESLPPGFDKKKRCDLIIGLHGHGSDRWQFAKDMRGECLAFRNFAANHGMIAISPDYRTKTSWMGPAAESDLLQLIRMTKEKYRIDSIFLVGGSMGGTSALTFAALHPEWIDGIVSFNGHANHLEFHHFQDAISASFGGSKSEIPEEYKKRSAEYWPEKLSMPVAFSVGAADTIVPPESVLRLGSVLRQLNRRVLLDSKTDREHATNEEDSYALIDYVFREARTKNKE